MRIAFVDLLFSWPPHGGADVDLYHVVRGLASRGHDVALFVLSDPDSWERGAFRAEDMPVPAEHVAIAGQAMDGRVAAERIRERVDNWGPEAVFLCDGFFLKPYVALALAHYPLALRYYAYELACHRDILHFKDGAPCPKQYLETPEVCRPCAAERLAGEIRSGQRLAWTQEYVAARAYAPEYHAILDQSLRKAACAIVYNETMQGHCDKHCDEVFIIPGGVDAQAFAQADQPPAGSDVTILMTGRCEDHAKGLSVLLEAGERLAGHRSGFVIQATAPEDTPGPDWFRPLGWQDHAAIAERYRQADICVVPSIWDEPFGITALEAMAVGRPVCASRVGGLQGIVEHGETGYLFERSDSADLAGCLDKLIDSREARVRMGQAGRRRVEEKYTWDCILDQHYALVLDHLRSQGGG